MTESGTDWADTVGPVDPREPSDPSDPTGYEAIPLPEVSRGGGRAAHRRQRRRQRRIRNVGIGAVAMVVVAALVFLLGPGGDGGNDGDKAGDATTAPAAAATPPVLLAHLDDAGNATSLLVLSPAATTGGTVVLIPPGTLTELGALGPEPVSKSLGLGGAPRLQSTVENLLGVGMGDTAVVDDDALAALLAPVGPLTVDVPERVEQLDATGRVQVLFEAGTVILQPADAGRFLSAKGRSNDLSRLARHQRFLEAWIAAVRQRPGAAPTQPPALAKAFDALASGTVRTRVLPVEAFGTVASEELYKVRTAELVAMVAASFPGTATTATGPRPRVQVLNGTGAVGLADAVRNKLGPGFDLRLAGNANTFDHAGTEVVYYDRTKQAMAKRVRDALGVGVLVFSRNPLDVVDVTIIVGKDFGTA